MLVTAKIAKPEHHESFGFANVRPSYGTKITGKAKSIPTRIAMVYIFAYFAN